MSLRAFILLIVLQVFVIENRAQTLGFQLEDGRKRVEIPIEIYNNLIIVPLVLNGTLPMKFVIDTGVRTAILTEKAFTDILNLPYSRKYSISVPGQIKVIDAYVTPNVSLELPGVIGRGHALLVLEEDYLELRNYLGTDVHGILGYELFSRFVVETDYAKQTLTLTTPDAFRPRNSFRPLAMTIEDTKPFITGQVIQKDKSKLAAKLLVDSGASHGIILTPTTDSSIRLPPKTISSVIGRGLGGDITGKIGRIESLSLAEYRMNDVIAYYPDPNSYFDSLRSLNVFRNGSMGGELLSRFDVIYDFPEQLLYLKKNSSFKRKFYYNLSGITVKAIGSRLATFEITDVRKGSAGDLAGVKVGDKVLALNGVSSQFLHLSNITAALNAKPRKRVTLLLLRGDIRLKLRFELIDEL